MKKFTSTFIGASILITFAGVITKGIGMLREMILAFHFGIGLDYNIFLVGAVIPVIINSTFIYFGQNYFIPRINKLKNEGKVESKILSESLFQFILLGASIVIFLYLFSDAIINLYLGNANANTKEIGLNIFRIYIFTIPFFAGNSILAAYFQSKLEFPKPVIAQLTMNFSVVLLLLIFTSSSGIYIIPIAFLAGALVQIGFLMFFARKQIIISKEIFNKIFSFSSFFEKKLLLTLFIELSSLSYILIDRYFFEQVDEGGLAVLNYANALYVLPISIFAAAFSTAVFPKFSNLKSETINEIHKKLKSTIELSLLFFSFITLIYFLFGKEIISIVYQRGNFQTNGTELTFRVLNYYTISLIFFACYAIFNKFLYSQFQLFKLLILAVSGLIIKIVLNFIFVDSLKQDGLALSTSIAFIYLSVGSYLYVVNEKNFIGKYFYIKDIITYLSLTLLVYLMIEVTTFQVEASELAVLILKVFLTFTYFGLTLFLIKPETIRNAFQQLKIYSKKSSGN